ncbi:hypothetical protein OGR47_04835 [Methylocystis sp. MJC1]|jgi:hypothetical protein|uniref:hypothetical protein n=1 Tax=Methylocystis sp. MJC1 TaxID=2654282 RepID=UPI0013ECCE3B|nr:hypothetical protein [Methylocystis sp. MJC1]KAF2989778.1 hypothetical protein MJC1_03123 [Methylocystis sp. MJC1]MBU6526334.1 hypothetical protein [Methylocystis sp. MJC1]UZX12785.1 hypothetical protein OGR47_04835 [Methylocystis sp. MJC1]
MQVTFIRTTSDGRAIEVIGPYICIARDPVADGIVEIANHPNRNAILSAVPNATHMAGPLVLTAEEASAVRGALAAAQPAPTEPSEIDKRLREAVNTRNRNAGIE